MPTHATNMTSRTTYSLSETSCPVVQNASSGEKQTILAIHHLDTELHEHANTVHDVKDLMIVQNRDVHVVALKKIVLHQDIFPQDVRVFARNYFKQKNGLLFFYKRGGWVNRAREQGLPRGRISRSDQSLIRLQSLRLDRKVNISYERSISPITSVAHTGYEIVFVY